MPVVESQARRVRNAHAASANRARCAPYGDTEQIYGDPAPVNYCQIIFIAQGHSHMNVSALIKA